LVGTVAAARALLWLQREHPQQASAFIHAIFRALFVSDRNVGEAAVVMEIAQALGLDVAALAAGMQDDSIKNALRDAVELSINRGVFGAPTIFIDGEMFWGQDRLAQVER
jgi:2-hydroxychromene-2-carboxylate isomerase